MEYLLSTIEKAIQQYGIQLVLLDNLMTALDIGLDIDLYRAQSKFVDKLVKISKNYNVAVILVVHPRKNSLGADDNDVVSGSSDITNKVDVVMTYKRDKTLPDDERLLTISKNRLTGKLAIGAKAIKLYFDEASKRISDDKDNLALCQLQIWSKWKFRLIENIFYRRITAGKDSNHESNDAG